MRRVLFAILMLLLATSSAVAVFDSAEFNAGSGPLELRSITPAGVEVPPARELVLHFNRPVVPVGRMERDAVEIPVTIEPPLACEWRWLNTSSLACQLGEKEAMTPATQYTVTVRPGIRAEDGATLAKEVTHNFATERPRVRNVGFKTWRAPGVPELRVFFNLPVRADSVADHFYFSAPGAPRVAAKVSSDPDYKYYGESHWLLTPEEELPLDAAVQLKVEAGVVPRQGSLPGTEERVAVAFDTFPAFDFLGVRCNNNAGQSVLWKPGAPPVQQQFCNPLDSVSLVFTTPVFPSKIKEQVTFLPDLAGGRSDYDPWENRDDWSRLANAHRKGEEYVVELPELLQAYEPYTISAKGAALRDEFDRPLPRDLRLMFFTDHRPPRYAFEHQVAVLEKGVDSEVPLVVNNLQQLTLQGTSLTSAGKTSGLNHTVAIPAVQDVAFRLPLGVRELLGGASGVVAGRFETVPAVPERDPLEREFFAQVTPFNLQAKIGHFNSLVWVTDYASGRPVAGALVEIYREPFPGLNPEPQILARGVSTADGLVELPGSEKLDPQLQTFGNNDDFWRNPGPHFFVRCRKGGDLALLPLTATFDTSAGSYDEEGYYQGSTLQRQYSHMHAWGTTAQGVYRAGDTIDYKFYVRNQDNRSFVVPPREGYALQVFDPMDNLAYEVKELKLNEFGAAAGSFTVAASAPVGWYRFVLKASFRDGEWEPMRVLVSDFTPAPFRASTELNGELFHDGDKVQVATHARLHSGGPYADAGSRVTARLQEIPFTSNHPLARTFWFDSILPGYWEQRDIHQSEENVDASGDLTTTFKLSDAKILYGRMTVESAVRDDRGKYVASEATATYVGRDRFVGLRQSDWVLRKGKAASIEALVVDEFGTPAAGTPVKMTVEYRQTYASRVKGAGNAYLTRFEHEWVKVASAELAPAAAPEAFAFTPEKPGYYRVSAAIEDTAGREQSTVMYRWAAGAGEVLWETGADNALSVIPEKNEVKIGETARFLVQNPYPGAKALVTIERYGVLKSWVTTFADSTAVVEVPVEPDYVPGFFLSVTLFSPRVDKPLDEEQVDLGKPAFRIGYVSMAVRDPYKELVVTAKPQRELYRPRETVTVDLQVAPRQSGAKLPPTELCVVVLDEAVLDLIQGGKNYYDVYKGFYTLDGLDLRTYNLLMQLVGRQKFEKKGASPGGDGGPDLAMRSLFKFVAYWNPSLRTDAKGKARITFPLPDNLTGWRVLALAVTPNDRMGLGDATFKVNQPTELRPALPNQLGSGDSVQAGFTVMNRTDHERTLTVKLVASGPLAAPASATRTVVAPPYKRVSVWLPLRTKGEGELVFTAKAFDGEDGDAFESKVPVRRRVTLETAATYGTTTAASVEERIAFPAGIHGDLGGVSVVAAPTVIGNVAGAFTYMRDYPYGCWEQKLTKGVMASHYRQLHGYLPAELTWPEAAELPQQTLKLARDFQTPNGGMSYYGGGNDYANPYLSAYTALAFNWLRAAGETVPTEVEARLHGYLLELLRRDEFPSFYNKGMAATVRAVALAALAPHGKLSKADLERYRPHLVDMSLFGQAHYLQALLAVKGTEALRLEAARSILAHGNETGGKFLFSEALDGIYAQILTTPLRDNAAILSALLTFAETPEGEKLVADVPFKLVRAITQGRGQRDYWENTQENMFCLNALIDYARRYETQAPAFAVRAKFDGQEFGQASFKAFTDPAATLNRPMTASDPGRSASVRLEKEGAGRLYYAARVTFAPLQLPSEPANAGIEARREYSVERKGRWVLLDSPMQIKTGELVRVDLYLSLPAPRHFVVVDDPVPGGLEPVNRDLATASKVDDDKAEKRYAGSSWWFRFNDWHDYGYSRWSFYHRELRHHAVRYYSEYLSAGNYHLSYVAQAIAPGEFTVAPMKAEEMYDADIFGRTPAAVLKVSGGE